jgi:hypothetical protein
MGFIQKIKNMEAVEEQDAGYPDAYKVDVSLMCLDALSEFVFLCLL